MNGKLFNRNFSILLVGRLVELLGSSLLSYGLPIYLLSMTHSASTYGTISAISTIPMLVFAMIGGLLADRVKKNSYMALINVISIIFALVYALSIGKLSVTIMTAIVLLALYACKGAYDPAMQSIIPHLVEREMVPGANGIINTLNYVSMLAGPALAGMMVGNFGINAILIIAIILLALAFLANSTIKYEYQRIKDDRSIIRIAKEDLLEGFRYVVKDKVICPLGVVVCLFNMIAAVLNISLTLYIMEYMALDPTKVSTLYGYAGAMQGLGGIVGGLLLSISGGRIKTRDSYLFLMAGTLMFIPMAICFNMKNAMLGYYLLLVVIFITMGCFAIISIQVISYVQIISPSHLLAKIMAISTVVSQCAAPIGTYIYGQVFEVLGSRGYLSYFAIVPFGLLLGLWTRKILKNA